MEIPYKILEPTQVFALNITTDTDCDKCQPSHTKYIVKEDGNYYITLNGVRQYPYDFPCVEGDIICMSISSTEVLIDIKKINTLADNYEYLEPHMYILKKSEPLSKTQQAVYSLVHFFLIIILPIILLEEYIKDPISNLFIFMTYIICSGYISLFVQKHITNKIFKLIYNEQ